MAQTTFTADPAIGQEGQISSSVPHVSISKIAEGAVSYGLAVVQGTADNQCKSPAAVAADDDAIMESLATLGNGTGNTYAGEDFDGAVGTDIMNPARNITVTLASDADWNATVATLRGLDEFGNPQVESLTIPDAGNTTVVGELLFSKVHSITFPAQGGDAAGSVGIGTKVGSLKALGVAVLDQHNEEGDLDYDDNEPVHILKSGRMFVITEAACSAGGQVFVRLVAGVGEELGAITSAPDGTVAAPDCAPLFGAKFVRSASAESITEIELA